MNLNFIILTFNTFYREQIQVVFPRLNCKIIGLRSVKGMDGVDFMLNKKEVKLTYLHSEDALEALWLDLENHAVNNIV